PLGFDSQGLTTGELALPFTTATWREESRTFTRKLGEELRRRFGSLPIALGSEMPYNTTSSSSEWTLTTAGASVEPITSMADVRLVSSNYFDVLGVRVLRGRGFTPADVAGSEPVAVVNETFVREFARGAEVMGAELKPTAGSARPALKIVGVVAD